MRRLPSRACVVLVASIAGLMVASCGNGVTQSAPLTTVNSSGVPCLQAVDEYKMITKAESQLGNNSAMTPHLYATKVEVIAKASAWLADHATGVSLNARRYWGSQSLSMSSEITKAANSGTATDQLIQYSGTAQSAAFLHDGQRVVSFYIAACPGFATG